MEKNQNQEVGNLPTLLCNNFVILFAYSLSFFIPVYVWVKFPSYVNIQTQVGLGILAVLFFYLLLKLACYVYKNLRKPKDKKISKIITLFYLITGAVNFILFFTHLNNSPDIGDSDYVKLMFLIVLGIVAYMTLKKRKSHPLIYLLKLENR